MENLSAKTKAIIAYMTFVGTLIAFFINKDNKHEFTTWHIKNMFGLLLLLIISQVTQAYVDLLFGEILWLIAFVLWVFSLIMAILNKKQAIPYFSDKFQEWFTFLD
ncbi:hypothetical protein INR76_11665 [Marixanthomonas sp. SCSIO 43207]|uniref:hypothetical protein n=1 Tax=Marixanthomonas sp. SCSIO 43207 TaxID=2779360 RepID=UPI001CA97229|nr:hypothetical protein [Marixanthomonas sp. SCSIO 43207]UAB80761.1 hypothetical protein INR76_11665 [Marixanthomonas sp. SCSIO 43207]